MKTTNRRIPASGHIPPMPGTAVGLLSDLISIGPMARSVGDLRLALELLAGPDGRQNDLPPVPLRAAPEKAWAGYHIAWCDEIEVPVNAEIRAAIASLASSLKRLGAAVVPARPDFFSLNDVLETYGELVGAQMAVSGLKPPLPDWALRMAGQIEKSSPMIRGYERGMCARLPDYAQSLSRRDETMRVVEQFLEGYDAWLLPVACTPAFRHIPAQNANSLRLAALNVDGLQLNYMTATSAYVCPFNVTGQPVVVIPIGKTKAGLPIGVQIAGRRWSDEVLLALAEKISSELTGPFCPPEGY
jgi:amidase